jgi:hypothetical protein
MFSPGDPVEELWIKSYQGEVLGEILFGRMAEQTDDPDHARKLRVLSKLERKTKEAMVPSLERAGIPTEPDPDTVQAAEAMADGMGAVSWLELVGSLEPVTTQYAAMYARIGELDPSERATADLLVAHELALRSFGVLELAGDDADSLAAINALPHLG